MAKFIQETPSKPSPGLTRRRRYLFGTCLAISLATHISALIMLIFSNPPQRHEAAVHYVDIANFSQLPPPSQEISNPAETPVRDETKEPTPPDEPIETKTDASKNAATGPAQDIMSSPLALGMANGYFSTLADGRTLREDIRSYYFEILEKINERWWQKAGTFKEAVRHDGIVEIQIGRDGKLYDARLTWDTGSKEADSTIIDVLTDASPYPPLPASFGPDIFRAPLRITAPSQLFRIGENRK